MRRLAAAAFAVAIAAACGGASPTSPLPGGPPVPAAASFEGVWRFQYRTEQCGGDRNCFALLGRTADFSVRLMKAGGAYAGVVLLSGANVDVTGMVDADGALVLTGVRPAAVEYDTRVEVERLALRHDGATLAGDVTVTAEGHSSYEYGEWRKGGPIVSSAKVAEISDSLISDFTGTWIGNVAERSCVSGDLQNCDSVVPRDVNSFALTLTGAGGRVTGVLRDPRDASIDGTIAGATLLAQGHFEERGTTGLVRITTVRPSSLTRDILGRLKGTLRVEVQSTIPDGRVFSSAYVFELIDVVLMPPS